MKKRKKNNAVLETEKILCVLAYSAELAEDYDETEEEYDDFVDSLPLGMFVWNGTDDIESGDYIMVDTICGSEKAIVYDVVYLPKYETKYLSDAWEY